MPRPCACACACTCPCVSQGARRARKRRGDKAAARQAKLEAVLGGFPWLADMQRLGLAHDAVPTVRTKIRIRPAIPTCFVCPPSRSCVYAAGSFQPSAAQVQPWAQLSHTNPVTHAPLLLLVYASRVYR